MQKAIIGYKVGMTQLFDEKGKVIPVTVIQAGPCTVVQKKTAEKEGYEAVQLGFDPVKDDKPGKAEYKLGKPEFGHTKKAGAPPYRHLREFRLEGAGGMNVGDTVDAGTFAEGDRVDITGTSKGKGFAGVIKRHGFGRHRMSHGGGPVHRHQGSLGANSDPARVFPGQKMAGHLGNERVTVMNLDIVKVDANLNLIAVRGAVPGPRGGLVTLRNSNINQ
jgi:large subunit ribosomal protein L3